MSVAQHLLGVLDELFSRIDVVCKFKTDVNKKMSSAKYLQTWISFSKDGAKCLQKWQPTIFLDLETVIGGRKKCISIALKWG